MSRNPVAKNLRLNRKAIPDKRRRLLNEEDRRRPIEDELETKETHE